MAQTSGTEPERWAPSRDARKEAAVYELLQRMARALTSGDGKTVAALWETPALVLGDEHDRAVTAPEEVEHFFGGAREQYNAQGIVDTRPDVERLEWLTPRICLADVRWPYLDAAGRELGAERSTYVLRLGPDGAPKLRAAIMRGVVAPH